MDQTEPVDHPVGKFGCDDFAAQAVAKNVHLEFDPHRRRESCQQFFGKGRVIWHGAVFQRLLQDELAAGQHHRQLGPGQPAAIGSTAGKHIAGSEALGLAVKMAALLQCFDQA